MVPDAPPPGVSARALEPKVVEAEPVVDVATWQATVDCECSGSWDCPHATAFLYGLQFHPDTWASHGGLEFGPNPSPAEQVVVGWRVLASHESDPWPNCPDPGD